MAQRTPDGIRLSTKQGADYASRYGLIVTALSKLKVDSIYFDDEVMCFTRVQPDFEKLRTRKYDLEARLCAFDLLELD